MKTLGFVINCTEKDEALANHLPLRIKFFYPDSEIIIIKDDPRLKKTDTVGQWIARYLTALSTDLIVKIDPDTEVLAKAKVPFDGDVFCAKKWRSSNESRRYMPHAGVIGFSRKSAIRIAKEAVKPEYVDYPTTRDDYNEEIVLRAIFLKLELDVQDRLDFHCGLKRYNAPVFASFRHP
jgi:hypothetical protein